MTRKLTQDDVLALKMMLDDVYAQHPFPIGGGWTERLLREALNEGQGIALVQEPSPDIQAFLIYRSLDEVLDITVLATALQHQRKGLMKALLREVLKSMANRRMWLEVHEGNTPAVALYESLGFQLQGRRPQYYRDGGTALLYSLEKLLL